MSKTDEILQEDVFFSFDEYYNLFKSIKNFKKEKFYNSRYNLFINIIENYKLDYEQKISLFEIMKNKNFSFYKTNQKEVFTSFNFFFLGKDKDIEQVMKFLSFFEEKKLDLILYSYITDINPSFIPLLKKLNNNDKILNEDIIYSYLIEVILKKNYIKVGGDKYRSLDKYFNNLIDSKVFSIEDIKKGYNKAEEKLDSLFQKKSTNDLYLFFKNDLKTFISHHLEKKILSENLTYSDNIIKKKRV